MSETPLDDVLKRFGRQMTLRKVVHVGLAVLFVGAMASSLDAESSSQQRTSFFLFMAVLGGWILLTVHSVRHARQVQAGRILMGLGKMKEARHWLTTGMTGFSLSAHAPLAAGELLAALHLDHGAHKEVVAICRALLRHASRKMTHVRTTARLMLADSLLALGDVDEAYTAMMPVYDTPLPLEGRTRLLPIQLRYELATGHTASAVAGLREKVQLAEILGSEDAALAHALLAEACRRENLAEACDYLAERANLYHDLAPLAQQWPIIAPIAARADVIAPRGRIAPEPLNP